MPAAILGAWLAALASGLGACGESGGGGGGAVPTVPATFTVTPGVEQVTVTGAPPKTQLELVDESGRRLLGIVTDDAGQAVIAYVGNDYLVYESASGGDIPTTDGHTIKRGRYTLRNERVSPVEATEPFAVLGRDDVAPDEFYASQTLTEGFNYIEMRDGVRLSAMIRFPDPALWGEHDDWPTVVEYSGYSPSRPDDPEPVSAVATLLGYVTVGVNMRGTGCSGGVFDVFNVAQHADGYDIIEVVARQPWARHGKVGMVGISYSGISQLFVASTRPPHLAAITAMSVIDDPWRQQWPGGVYNQGFTRQWLAGRDSAAAPGGVSWVSERIERGDAQCEENLAFRRHSVNFEKAARTLQFYHDDLDARRLGLLVPRIDVPVYLTGGWQDEQTGSQFATMLDAFDAAPLKRFILYNGRHPDSMTPLVATRWLEFLELFVARRVPAVPPIFRLLAPALFDAIFGAPLGLEPDRFAGVTDYAEAIARYEAEPQVRVLFEAGAGYSPVPGAPAARFEASFDAWPPADARPRLWYLANGGRLLDEPPADAGVDAYRHDPGAGEKTYTDEGATDFINPMIEFDWPPPAEGTVLSYLSEPLDEDVVVVGNGGHVALWFASDASDANVEVTLTEVRPDGVEYIVQSGLLRPGHGRIDEALSDTFHIDYTYREEDFEPLVPGEFREILVPIRPFAQAFRAGSRLRLIVDTPGRDSPLWAYENPDYGAEVRHRLAYGPARPAYVLLPVVDGIEVPAGLPPCPALRGQVCRAYEPRENERAD